MSAVGCLDPVDFPDQPHAAGALSPTGSCKDSLGTTWTVAPVASTVTPGANVHFVTNRNGSLYTPGPGSPVVHYEAPDGGTLADPDGIETDYTAGAKVGDYRVNVKMGPPGAPADGTVCSLQAIVHVVATLPAGDGGVKVPAPSSGGRPVSFEGAWMASQDANGGNPAPVLTLAGISPSSISVAYQGADGNNCGCNAEHLVIPLGKSYDCGTTTMEFDYAAGGSFGYTSSQALSIRFCKDGACSSESFYGGDQYVASQQSGHSNCGYEWANNTLPASQLASGHNVVELGKLTKEVNGSCSGSFDTIDVHVQAYACFKDRDYGVQTLSNLVLR
jgi:hypothetical protein